MMLMEGKRKEKNKERMKKTKRINTLLLSRVASLLKGKQKKNKKSLIRVLQQGCRFSPISRGICQQLGGNPFGSRRR
jgi:hypothetical protein